MKKSFYKPWVSLLGSVSDPEIGRRFGVNPETVRSKRVNLGILSFNESKALLFKSQTSKKCTLCKEDKPLEKFSLEKKRGEFVRRARCKVCRKKEQAAHRKEKYKEWRTKIDKLKSVPCALCGESFPSYMMDFDHKNPKIKVGEISVAFGRVWALTELSKCNVVCARCHRLCRSSKEKTGSKRQFLRELKNVPCADCGGKFHYSQMDFDHVRGEKLGSISNLSGLTLPVILEEVSKCDVVCANCHRERTHKRKSGIAVEIKRVSPKHVVKPWQQLVGKISDQAVEAWYGLSHEIVWGYRKENKIPSCQSKSKHWQHLVGTMSDSKVAGIGGVTKSAVGFYRRRLGISAHTSQRAT